MKKIITTTFLLTFFLLRSFGQETHAKAPLAVQPTAFFTFDTLCSGQMTTLTNASTLDITDSIIQVSWDLNGDLLFNDAYGNVVIKDLLTIPGIHPNQRWDIGMQIKTKLGYQESVYRQVPLESATADFTSENFCFGDITKFYDQSSVLNGHVASYEWTIDNNYGSNLANPTWVYNNIGTYPVSLTVTSNHGCIANIVKNVTIYDIPHISITTSLDSLPGHHSPPGQAFCPYYQFYTGQSLTVNLHVAGPGGDIIWSNDPSNKTLTNVITQTGFYTVEVKNADGCVSTLCFQCYVFDDETINPMPVITPNGDGVNDVWKIKDFIMPNDNIDVKIYNRYGDEVYSKSNYQNDWGGTYNGKVLPDGPYYYWIKNNQDSKVYKGAVNILTK